MSRSPKTPAPASAREATPASRPRVPRAEPPTRSLHATPFDDPMWETFALIARRDAPVSPATRAFVELVEERLEGVGELLMYQGATSAADG